MATEIEQLLKRLSDTISEMSVTNQNSLLIHHYRGKLHDYNQEFKKTSGNIKASREHAELLHSVRRDIKDAHNSESFIRRSVNASDRTASAIIEQAEQSQEALRNQKRNLLGAQSKMGGMDGMFSSIGSLMSQIQRKKMRDQIILAMVISFCATFIFVYWLRDNGMI
uniref:Sec20 C-terminal domain-containing protein n=1 Tax=Paramoeba aestuarina TaxID=180227 RepID=A0A7S4KXN5_9EUKA